MALQNLISIVFTDAEIQQMNTGISMVEAVLNGKTVQLKSEESQRYGKLGNETENWAEMIHADSLTVPSFVPAFVDKPEWEKDETARSVMSPFVTRLEAVTKNLGDTNRLVGFDLYHTCLAVYNNVKYLAAQNVPGSSAYYEKWKVQFPAHHVKAKDNPQPPPVQQK